MDFYPLLLAVHILGATIWTGGHLVLALSILPAALRDGNVSAIRAFETAFERVGLPALAVQVATGLWLALRAAPVESWADLSDPLGRTSSSCPTKSGCSPRFWAWRPKTSPAPSRHSSPMASM